MEMTQDKKKKSNEETLANREANIFNQISIINGEEGKNLSRCQQKKNSLLPDQICKGKSVLNNTTEQMDIVYPQAMGIQLGEEIIMEILCKLPVQSILRFRCVLKSWKALISDPYFKMKHLNHAKNDRNSQKLFMSKMCFEKDNMFSFYSSSLSSLQVVEDDKKLDWPSNFKPVNTALCCCCDGLVVILVFDKLHSQLVLWNPSTGESMALPHPNFPQRSCVFGLGYDATSDDYKILVVNLNDMGQEASGEIFTLKSGSWKKICQYPAGIHRLIGFKDCGMNSLAFVHGAFYWVGLSGCYTIVSFNISNEVYGEIPLPEHMCNILDARFPEYGVSVLGGMLCFYSTYHYSWEGLFKLWVMKDYGVKESWTELVTIHGGLKLFYAARPIYMYEDGEVLLRCNYFEVTDSVYRTSREPFKLLPQCPAFRQGVAYTQSLIFPKSSI